MEKIIKTIRSFVLLVTALAVALTSVSLPNFTAFAADEFETSIAAFPASYQVKLRELHKKYPKWKFVPLNTNLDWNASVDAEFIANRSLISASTAYSDIFRSFDAGDYDFAAGKFIQKDAGFVRANKLAVSYYMDPRNFLNEEAIFQFEDLTFNSQYTAAVVEQLLAGSFMANKTVEYLDSDGKLIKTKQKYSQLIYNAGKKYNVNPCYLASKILSEVGKKGSDSVSGAHKKYPGFYNFFNIGAYDGANPIENGLKYASSGTSYQRPWDSPEKAIMGGAQFCVESYIARGQQTSYLQRFNVNPASQTPVYEHQYMTNLTGAVTPAYTSYKNYKACNMLADAFVFTIPVFKNMTGEKSTAGTVQAADSKNQTAVFGSLSSMYNIRLGQSTMYGKHSFQIPKGTSAVITDTMRTDDSYYDNVLKYPFWHKFNFNYGGKAYSGFAYSNFLDLTTETVVPVGTYSPIVFRTNAGLSLKYVSTDPRIARIDGDTKITFLKEGVVKILAYDSIGNYQQIKYRVAANAANYRISGISVTEPESGKVRVNFTKNPLFRAYEVFITDANGKAVAGRTVTQGPVDFTWLTGGAKYSVYIRGLTNGADGARQYSSFAQAGFITKPIVVSGLKAARLSGRYDTVNVTWTKSSVADGFDIFTYNPSTKKYTKVGTAKGNVNYFRDKSANAVAQTYYMVRAFKLSGSTKLYSDYSALAVYNPPKITPATPAKLKQSTTTNHEIKLTWGAVKDATEYEIQKYDSKKKAYVKVGTSKTNSFTLKDIPGSNAVKVRVRAVIKVYTKKYYGAYSAVFTAYTSPNVPAKFKEVSPKTNQFTLQWQSAKGSDAYQVYKYDGKKKAYVRIATTTKTSFVVKDLQPGKMSTYKVRSYRKTPNGTYYSPFTKTYQAATSPSKAAGLKVTAKKRNSYKLTWKKVSGATGYEIYRYNAKTKKYDRIKTVTGLSYTVTKLKPNTSAKYRIRAVTKSKNYTAYGAYSTVITAKTLR